MVAGVETVIWDANGRGWSTNGYFEHVSDGTTRRAKSKERRRRSVREDMGGRVVGVNLCLHVTHERRNPILFFEKVVYCFATYCGILPQRLRQQGR